MTAYYNEIDPQAAQWLRNLIAARHIAPGEVDERSIKDVQPHDLEGFRQCHFFAGIGVWSYALRRAGWADDRPVWTGSCPCQPFSAAGKGEGLDDPRHLWPDWFRLIRECGPVVVFGEQVAGPDGVAWLDLAQADLEEHSHTVGAVVTCSAGFGGPDIRQRLYWVADADEGRSGRDAGTVPCAEASVEWSLRGVADGAESRGAVDRLADATGTGCERRVEQDVPRARRRGEGRGTASRGISPCGLADIDGGLQGDGGIQRGGQHGLAALGDQRPGPLNGFWRAADWLFCTDGKWRPVEPALAAPFQPRAPMPLRWREQPEAKRDAIESLDNFAPLRNKLRGITESREEWAGIPLPIEGEHLVVESSYPFAPIFNERPAAEPSNARIRNTFYSSRRRCDVMVYEEDGRLQWGIAPAFHHLRHDITTLGCSFAWGLEQESNAIHLLGSIVKHIAFKQYLLTGMFLERSERSGITYVFRRLKPTVALKPRDDDEMRILCALCMHPIAYYQGSWAGAMCPTDDVIAHLMLMRGDEPMFWRRCNQHPPWRPEAGL